MNTEIYIHVYCSVYTIRLVLSMCHLPASGSNFIIGKVVSDPVVDISKCHLLLLVALDSKWYKSSVAAQRYQAFTLIYNADL